MDDLVAKALHAARQHFDEGGFLSSLSNLFSGPDYLSTGEVASPTNWGDPESAADFFKADRALRLAREASEPARDTPLPLRRPVAEAAPRQQVAAPPPAPAPAPAQAFRPVTTLPIRDVDEPHNFPPVTTPSLAFGEPVYGEKTQRLGGDERQNRASAVQMDYTLGHGQNLWPSSGNFKTLAGTVPENFNSRFGNLMSVDDARQSMMFRPEPRAEISRAVSLAQNLAPARQETIPSAADALAAVEKLHNAGVYSGEALDKAGEILAAHNRAMFDSIPVEEALRLNRAEGPRMVNQGMPREERPTVQPLAYTAAPTPAPAQAAINTATTPTTDKLTARVDPNSEAERANNVWNRMLIQESGGRQFDRNGNTITSPVGALGISQVMPSTGPEAAQLAGLPWSLERLRTDPEYNHALGRAYYEAQLERFGDPTLAAAAYNGGPNRVAGALRQARETGRPWTAFLRPETQNYVRIVTAQPRAEGGLVDDALHVVREHHADGEAVGQAPIATDNSERVRAAEDAANLAKQIQAYEASMASIRQQPQDIQSMTHAPEKPRAPISVEALGKNREFGSAPYDVAGPLSSFAQGAYDMKTLPLYMYPPTAPLGMAIDTAEGVASGSPIQVAMGALGGPLKVARNVIAPLAVATGVAAPDEAEAGSLERAMRMIRAYHGSPHKFDRFDLSKIGTGEGAQAFGHGLYFAEHEPTARFYRDQLSDTFVGGQPFSINDPRHKAASILHDEAAGDRVKAADLVKNKLQYGLDVDPFDENVLRMLEGKIDLPAPQTSGHMYDVNIDAKPDQLLGWNAPLRDTPQHLDMVMQNYGGRAKIADEYAAIQKEIEARLAGKPHSTAFPRDTLKMLDDPSYRIGELIEQAHKSKNPWGYDAGEKTTGKDLYEVLRRITGGKPNASQYLNDAGVPGIKYLDAGSRNRIGDPTHNYVIFDDKLIDINRRYAEGGQIPEGNDMRDHFESGGLKLVNKLANTRAKIGHNNPPVPRIFPEMAERYPLTKEPVEAFDKKKGEYYLAKDLTPEALAIQKARKAAQATIDKGDYTPFFAPEQRFDVDPTKYPDYTPTTSVLTKKPATQAKYDAIAGSPEASTRLDEAYARGLQQQKDAENWYFMGQLEKHFIEEYGPELGPKMFKQRFADPMAATTGGADPTSNLMMAHYGNYLKEQGLPVPEHSYEYPFPIGGRYAAGNMDQYRKMIMEGQGITHDNPKRYNFSYNFTGHKGPTIDEQMSQMFDPKMNMPPAGTYGHYETALANRAANAGVDPRYFQEVAWAGKKDADSKTGFKAQPMIGIVNEAVERTHQITGMPRDEIVRRGLVRAEIPLYGAAGATAAGAVAPELMQGQGEAPAPVAEAPMTEERKRGGSIVDRALMLVSRQA